MLRHSMALKWFAIGKLVHAARLGHLAPDEASDFRAQFGDTWHLVQTMLGHRRVDGALTNRSASTRTTTSPACPSPKGYGAAWRRPSRGGPRPGPG
jgi:hypothetical protein